MRAITTTLVSASWSHFEGNCPYTQVIHDQMEDGQCLLEWYTTTLLFSRLISRGSLGQLWNRTWMIMTRILFNFLISRPWQCSSSQLSSSSHHLETTITSTMLLFYCADFRWIEFMVYTGRQLHSIWDAVTSILYSNVDGVLCEVEHQHLGEDDIISTFSREVFYFFIVVSCPSTPMYVT
jgi:hypothetical protein